VILWPERDVDIGPPRHPPGLDALSQADLPFELLPLFLRGDGHATSEDHIDLFHLLIVVGRIGPTVFSPSGFLGRLSWWWWLLLAIQKSFALF
jgi:hypothetical protein